MATTTKHECPGRGCRTMISRQQLACPKHWFKVSKATRDRVWIAYVSRSDDHAEALAHAILEMNR